MNQADPRERRADLIFWAAAFVLFFWALGSKAFWGSEDRWAEVTREMFLTGDFFHPTINGQPYFDKPLVGYWLVALLAAVTGRLNEWTVRIPSALAGLAGLWGTIYLGTKLWSRQVGRTAAWLLLSTYGIMLYARLGMADMENLAAIVLAVAWYWARRDRPNFLTFLVFYLILFIGAHTKGLTSVVIPFVAVFPDVIREGRWKKYLLPSNFLAFIIGVAVYFAPFVLADFSRHGYRSSGIGLAIEENLVRYFQPFDHQEPFYVYLYYVPMLLLPWAALLILACVRMFGSYRSLDRHTRWLVEATILIFLFFTASGSRRSYYILPIVPFCGLLTAVYLVQREDGGWKKLGLAITWGVLLVVAAARVIVPVAWPFFTDRIGVAPPLTLSVGMVLFGLLAVAPLVYERRRPGFLGGMLGLGPRLAPLALAAAVTMGGYFCFEQQQFEEFRGVRQFGREVSAVVNDPEEGAVTVASFKKGLSSNALFYIGSPTPVLEFETPEELERFLDSTPGTKVLVSDVSRIEEIQALFPLGGPREPAIRQPVSPFSTRKNRGFVAWVIRPEKE